MTLIILDMQDKLLVDLAINDGERVTEEVSREIIKAREDGEGIVIAETNVKEKGGISDFVLDLVADYDRVLRFEHSSLDAGDEILSIVRQQNFGRDAFRVCGLYGDGVVKETIHTILYSTNFQACVILVPMATGCVNHLYSNKDCLEWAVKIGVEIA